MSFRDALILSAIRPLLCASILGSNDRTDICTVRTASSVSVEPFPIAALVLAATQTITLIRRESELQRASRHPGV